ncbi:MAG: hypothetical protein QNK30_11540 [Bacteroidales bacterium]|nr:hypothetical protein [Bacteroidales bacterium]
MKTIADVASVVTKIGHPAINYSLTELGILSEIDLIENTVEVVFAFPFPDIPIADTLINSISEPIKGLGLDFEHSTRIMTDEERAVFMQLEKEGWK